MSITFKTAATIADEYLTHLKNLKPEVNVDQQDSDWWIRAQVVGGVLSGMYADQQLIANDAFPQSARREALDKHLFVYFDGTFIQPTNAQGNVIVNGATGTSVAAGTQFVHQSSGNTYEATDTVVLDAATGLVPVQSSDTGQDQNLLPSTTLNIPSPPPGLGSSATVDENGITDGRDVESNEEAAARILARIRSPLSGGTFNDYIQWARDASGSVTGANVLRFPFGFGTVGVVITAGTTDIDTAIDNDDPIIITPSEELIQTVQDYIDTKRPLTDCATVLGPDPIEVDVTVKVRFVTGDKDTILTGQTVSQGDLVKREVRRALYKTPIGGRVFGASGFVVASEIEEVIDASLSALPYTVGSVLQIVADRQVQDLSATGPNLMILGNQAAVEGTITIAEF